jgi:hypothetical protein
MGRNRERDKIRELVSAYIDGELPPDDAQYVGRRIQEDPAYARVYSAYRGIRMDMRALNRPEMPASLSASIRAQAAVMQPRRAGLNVRQRVARFTTAVAALAATLIAVLTGGFGLEGHFAHVTTGGGGSGQPSIVSVSTGGPTTATILNPSIHYDESAQISFTRPVDEQVVLTKVVFSPAVPPNLLQYDKQQSILSTKPKSLLPDTRYTVQIPAGLKDTEGHDIAPATFAFTVGNLSDLVSAPTVQPAMTVAPTATAITVANAPTPNVTPDAVVEPAVTATTTTSPDEPQATEAPAATEVPAVAQPTAVPQVAPRPTNTPVPTAKPAGTVIAVAQPTATNTPVPPTATATAAPTATAVPATPTVVPTATTPAIPVASQFQGAYAATANRLGSPTGGAQAISGSQILFQNGFMLYVSGQPIYVFYTGDRTYATYANPGNGGTGSEGGAGPSAGLYKPPRAFGVVWTKNNLQGRLGYATQANESGASGSIQYFDGGMILSNGGDVYVILKNGTWQYFSG